MNPTAARETFKDSQPEPHPRRDSFERNDWARELAASTCSYTAAPTRQEIQRRAPRLRRSRTTKDRNKKSEKRKYRRKKSLDAPTGILHEFSVSPIGCRRFCSCENLKVPSSLTEFHERHAIGSISIN